MTTLLLSVVVPAHNAEKHLPACLDALVASDLPRDAWQLIVVDDASTDNTPSIASARADIVLRTGDSPIGPAGARNRGAEAAAGGIITFIDADVAVHRESLRLLAQRLTSDSSLVAVFGSYDEMPADESLVSRYRNLLHHFAHGESAGPVSTFWAGFGAVRAETFRLVGGFDEDKYVKPQIEDIELGYRLRRAGTILLDPSIQGKHYKRWSMTSMMKTDLLDRAVPWVRLILDSEPARGASTPSLGARALVGTASAGGSVAAAVLALTGFGFPAWVLAATLLMLCVAVNFPFYRWLWPRGGWRLVVSAVPLHFGYQFLSAVAIPLGSASFLLGDTSRNGTRRAVSGAATGSRFLPLAVGEAAARLVAFAATAYLARRLGASGFGQIAFATAVVAHFGTALAVGIGEVGAREVARAPNRAPSIAAAGITLRLCCAFVAILAIVGVTLLMGLEPGQRMVTWLFALSVIPLALDTGWVYKGLGRTGTVGAALLVAQISGLALVLLFVSSPSDVARVPLIQLAGDLAAAAFLLIPLMRGRWVRPAAAAVRSMALRSRMITVSRVLRTIVVSLDVVILGLMASSREVGWYSAAYRIVFFVMAMLYAAHVTFLPEIARWASAPRALAGILSRSIGLAVTVTIPFVVGGALVAPSLMGLIFGDDYRSGAVALQLLLVSLIPLAIHGATRNVFLAMHRVGLETMIIALGVVVNVVLNVVLIPRYGIVGAAIATVGGESVILIGAFVALYRMGVRPELTPSLPALAAAAIMAGVLVASPAGRPVLASVAAGAMVYIAVLAAGTIVSRRRSAAVSRRLVESRV